MVDFTQEFRHYCRNPRCRMKLPAPVENVREAFCARGCYEQYYRLRCIACEELVDRSTKGGQWRMVCKKADCRRVLRRVDVMGRYFPPKGPSWLSETSINKGSEMPLEGDRGAFRVIAAGKPISASAFYCATVGAGWALADNAKANAKWACHQIKIMQDGQINVLASPAPITAGDWPPEKAPQEG